MRGFFGNYRPCPACGRKYAKGDLKARQAVYDCGGCGFQFWQNSKPAVGLIIPRTSDPGSVLITRRAIRPHLGKLDVVGGFLGLHEDPEAGAVREAKEEIGRKVAIRRLFHVDRERYAYRGAAYSVLVMYYVTAPIAEAPKTTDASEIKECFFIKAADAVRSRDMAFGSDKRALRRYMKEAL